MDKHPTLIFINDETYQDDFFTFRRNLIKSFDTGFMQTLCKYDDLSLSHTHTQFIRPFSSNVLDCLMTFSNIFEKGQCFKGIIIILGHCEEQWLASLEKMLIKDTLIDGKKTIYLITQTPCFTHLMKTRFYSELVTKCINKTVPKYKFAIVNIVVPNNKLNEFLSKTPMTVSSCADIGCQVYSSDEKLSLSTVIFESKSVNVQDRDVITRSQ